MNWSLCLILQSCLKKKKNPSQACLAFCWKHFANLQIKSVVIKRLKLRFVFLEESWRWEKGTFRKRYSNRSIMTIEFLQRWEGQNRPPGEDSGAFPTPFLFLAIKWWRFVEHDTWLLCIMDLNRETKERANCSPCIQVQFSALLIRALMGLGIVSFCTGSSWQQVTV